MRGLIFLLEKTIEGNCFSQSKGGVLFFLLIEENSTNVFNLETKKVLFFKGELPSSKIVSFTHIEENAFSLIYEDGSIFSLNKEECIFHGKIENGITKAVWCPSALYLAILVKGGSLIVLSSKLDVVYEKALSQDVDKERKGLDWGSKEKQYKGREEVEIKKEEKIIDDRENIAWRFDSSLFAISFLENGIRVSRIYTNKGNLISTIEDCFFLGNTLSWKGCGNLIASNTKKEIVFIEQSGLRYGGFSLLGWTSPIKIEWNCDSTILASLHQDQKKVSVLLWTCSNYRWFLKQVFEVHEEIIFEWSRTNPTVLYLQKEKNVTILVFSNQKYMVSKHGHVSFVNGKELYITNFETTGIPPPYYETKIDLPSVPIQHVFSQCGEYLAFLFKNSFGVFDLKNSSAQYSEHLIISPKQILLVNQKLFLISSLNGENVFSIDRNGKIIWNICIENAERIVYGRNSIIVLSFELKLTYLSYCGNILKEKYLKESPEEFSILPESEDGLLFIGKNKRLYHNENILLENVTSFQRKEEMIIAISEDNILHFFSLRNNLFEEEIKERRNVELGSRIVFLSEMNSSILLQMPRGNIERIYPRNLVWNSVKKLFYLKKFKDSFLLCKKHQIKPKYLFEEDKKFLLENISTFIRQLNSEELLNLFVISIGKECEDLKQTECLFEKIRQECKLLCYKETTITTYVFCLQPNLEMAAKEAEGNSKALDYLSFLVTPKKIFNVFLGLYNTETALSVIRKTQEDPAEYISLLEKLKSVDRTVCRFKIDNHLKNYKKALRNLYEIEKNFELVIEYAKEHSLLKELIILSKENVSNWKKALCVLANELIEQNDFKAATTFFYLGGDFFSAYKVAIEGLLWRKVFEISTLIEVDLEGVPERIVSGLINKGEYVEAYSLCIEQNIDAELTLDIALKGKLWEKAVYLSFKYGANFKKITIGSLLNEKNQSIKQLVEGKERLKELLLRLPDAKERTNKRIEDYFLLLKQDEGTETFSQTTNTTVESRKSFISGLSFQKRNKKHLHGKKGSWHEVEFLLTEIKKEIELLNKILQTSQSLIDSLNSFFLDVSDFCDNFEKIRKWIKTQRVLFSHIDLSTEILEMVEKTFLISNDVKEAVEEYRKRIKQLSESIPETNSFFSVISSFSLL